MSKALIDRYLAALEDSADTEALAEENQQRELFLRYVKRGGNLPVIEIPSLLPKNIRIISLVPFVSNGYILFTGKHAELLKQLREYPMGKNDDAPDCLEWLSSSRSARGAQPTRITARCCGAVCVLAKALTNGILSFLSQKKESKKMLLKEKALAHCGARVRAPP